ncbi:hypothetical protein C900_03881 [Fulvivirga imtechensis AK7]|uniref:HNH nuclease domain-containing protein n=1 Tax=Fulvivirga imtechensis AK7 TaxID=1237149 RepID=L8JMP3_9BACT|nr:HNH endonuclease signature motif containing protein [Fulvivirga imtechensis]ELR70196.1 hypothetical protein C900_03881 [Fulvivirga imtechensis AK7]
MQKCLKCTDSFILVNTIYLYHDIYECGNCGYWEFKRIEKCCRKPYLIVTIDHKSSGQFFLYWQCTNCGGSTNRSKPLSSKIYGEKIRNEFSISAFEAWKYARNNEGACLAEDRKHYNLVNSRYYKYHSYIASDEWRKKRKLVLERDHYLCQECKERPAEEVHHKTYNNLFDEPLEDLVSLCKKCHDEVHEKKRSGLVDR